MSVRDVATTRLRFDRFRQLVFSDPILFDRLRQASEPATFAALAVRLSEDRGCGVTTQDVTCELQPDGTRLYGTRRSGVCGRPCWVDADPAQVGTGPSEARLVLAPSYPFH
jgi:hypothetical protein